MEFRLRYSLVLLVLSNASAQNWRQQPHLVAESGNNISLACPGVTGSSYVYLVEWVCEGCQCADCPPYSHNGYRLLRHNDQTVEWDKSGTRNLDKKDYTLNFSPVSRKDSGVYHCLVNNRGSADIPILLTVQDVPDPPPSRPMVSRISSRNVLLTWATPLHDNHAPIYNYRIFVRERRDNWTKSIDTNSNTTEFLIPDLKPFTTYTFRVSGQNQIGFSALSKESFQTMTHREKPAGKPVFLRDKIICLSQGFELYWTPPTLSSINGEFMGYVMTYRPTDSHDTTKLIVTDESLKIQNYSLSGLMQHTTYEITLAARNLEGTGPKDIVILKTEDGVPLKPRGVQLLQVDSNSVKIKWRKPENVELLGDELLGYRIYIRDMMCSDPSMELGTCEMIEPQTILGKDTTYATVSNLRPRTSYKLQIRGFTSKREGGDSNPLEVETDTAQPSPPTITVLNCTGKGDILLEWRRPRLYYGKVDYYMVYYRSDKDASFSKRKIDIISNNSSDIYIVYLTGLENDTNYNVAVSAVSVSLHLPGIEFESRLSVNKYVYLNYGCSPVSSSILIYTPSLNLVLVAAGLGALLVVILLVVSTFICRRRISGYGLVAVPPCTAYASGRGRGRGWTGEPESDIPGQLFPKHIQGLHASGDMAICKDYENLETTARQSSRKLYPDIVGGQGLTDRRPVSVDSWLSAGQFILIPGEGALVAGGTWRSIWENQVNLIVTIQTPRTRDDLSQISDSKFFGEYQVQVENETVSPDFLARNMKVRKGRQTRSVDQLLYTQWSERNIRSNLHSFLSFIKSAAASTQTLGGKVLICSRPTDDGGIYYMSLYTMIRQLEDTGDVNLSAYSRNLAESGIILENSSSYANLHDALSFVIDVDFNRNSYSV